MKKKICIFSLMALMMISLLCMFPSSNVEAAQISSDYMDKLILPTEQQYNYKDWKQTTIDYINYVLDETNIYDEKALLKYIEEHKELEDRYVQKEIKLSKTEIAKDLKADDSLEIAGVQLLSKKNLQVK